MKNIDKIWDILMYKNVEIIIVFKIFGYSDIFICNYLVSLSIEGELCKFIY